MKTTLHLLRCSATALLLGTALGLGLSVQATDLSVLKLHGRWTQLPSGYGSLATVVACSDKWIVSGWKDADEPAVNQGAVQVFNAVTGAWIRKVLPPPPLGSGTGFGSAVAISGDLAVVTAADINRAFVINLATGAHVRTLIPVDPSPHSFGSSVAIAGNRVVIGDLGHDGYRGQAYIFDLATGAQLTKIKPAGLAADDRFGWAAVAEGNVVAISAIGADLGRGAAYVFDLTTFALVRKVQPFDSIIGEGVGTSLAMHGGLLAMGAYGPTGKGRVFVVSLLDGTERTLIASDGVDGDYMGTSVSLQHGLLAAGAPSSHSSRGAVYLFDLHSPLSTEFQQLTPNDGQKAELGWSVSMGNNAVVVCAPFDDTQAPNAGALWVFRSITKPLPLTKGVAKGDSATGAPEINYNAFSDAFINGDGEVAFASSLTGAGSNGNKDTGIWSALGASHNFELVAKSRDPIKNGAITSVSKPLVNSTAFSIFRATLSGLGIGSLNNQAIYSDDGVAANELFRTGEGLVAFAQAQPTSYPLVVQSRGVNHRWAAASVLRVGVAGTTSGTDSGILWHDLQTSVSEGSREGAQAGNTGLTYGQFTGRVSLFDAQLIYPTAVAGLVSENQALFQKDFGNVNPTVIAQKGKPAVGVAGGVLAAFIGEGADDTGTVLYRATTSGGDTTSANNEGLWTRTSGNITTLVMRKGDFVSGLPGVRIGKFIHYWQTWGQTLALVQLTGTGVNSKNDQALLLYQTTANVSGTTVLLMREGDAAPGCQPATIATISRVEVEPFGGHYLVLCSLASAPTGMGQALFRGYTHKILSSANEQTLRRPALILRTGVLYANQPSKVKSISLPTTNLTAAGAGTVGLGRAIQETGNDSTPSEIITTITFDNGVVQLMKGKP